MLKDGRRSSALSTLKCTVPSEKESQFCFSTFGDFSKLFDLWVPHISYIPNTLLLPFFQSVLFVWRACAIVCTWGSEDNWHKQVFTCWAILHISRYIMLFFFFLRSFLPFLPLYLYYSFKFICQNSQQTTKKPIGIKCSFNDFINFKDRCSFEIRKFQISLHLFNVYKYILDVFKIMCNWMWFWYKPQKHSLRFSKL